MQHRIRERHVDDGIRRRVEHLGNLARPLPPRQRAPEVVHPQEPALEQVGAQAIDFLGPEPERTDIGRHGQRAIEQRVVGQPDDKVVRMPLVVAADARLGELGQPRRQIDFGVGIVRLPADAHRLDPHAAVGQTADDEGAVGHVRRARTAPAGSPRGTGIPVRTQRPPESSMPPLPRRLPCSADRAAFIRSSLLQSRRCYAPERMPVLCSGHAPALLAGSRGDGGGGRRPPGRRRRRAVPRPVCPAPRDARRLRRLVPFLPRLVPQRLRRRRRRLGRRLSRGRTSTCRSASAR